MLFDPTWGDLSLDSFIAWLEIKPAEGKYCYLSNGGCLIAQFVTSKGYQHVSVGGDCCSSGFNELKLPWEFYEISVDYPRTFGDALERARLVQSERLAGSGRRAIMRALLELIRAREVV